MTKLNIIRTTKEATLALRDGFADTLELSPEGPWLAGGAVLRAFTCEPGGDLDVFFKNEEQCNAWDHWFGRHWIQKSIPTEITVERDLTDRTTEYRLVQADGTAIRISLIRSEYFETLDAVLDSFDFAVSAFGFDGERIVGGMGAGACLLRRETGVRGRVAHPFSTWKRIGEYKARGFLTDLDDVERVYELIGEAADTWGPHGALRRGPSGS